MNRFALTLCLALASVGCVVVASNPCDADHGGCDLNASCVDHEGTPLCTCNPGFVGDGITCSVADPCQAGNGGCDPNATCTSRDGTVSCLCNPGFYGDGTTCAVGASQDSTTRYTGMITETYSCASSSPPAFALSDTWTIVETAGSTDVQLSLQSCPGQTLLGSMNPDGTITIPKAGLSCSQADQAGDGIEIVDAGGALSFDSAGNLIANLSEDATINMDDCTGSATGTLSPQQ